MAVLQQQMARGEAAGRLARALPGTAWGFSTGDSL
ncbi:hypothetical protein J2S47_004192 [Streptomyces griseoviridis]|uniref:Uncharacterized protein n=1 Tax=Streptomyces griseoviridis TaxID=45398 RepID=A0ABT9LKC7_STRGD|nr:hypothetical protein [Streptomyces griseoviridis]